MDAIKDGTVNDSELQPFRDSRISPTFFTNCRSQVLIRNGANGGPVCGGSVLNLLYVVTSAACVTKMMAGEGFGDLAGNVNLNIGVQP